VHGTSPQHWELSLHTPPYNTQPSVAQSPAKLQVWSQHPGHCAPGVQPPGQASPLATQVVTRPHVPSMRQVPEQHRPQNAPEPQVAEQSPPSIVQQRPPWHVLSTTMRQVF
jgi:hypothetical protein